MSFSQNCMAIAIILGDSHSAAFGNPETSNPHRVLNVGFSGTGVHHFMEVYHHLTPTLPLRSCHHSGTPWSFHEGHTQTLALQAADYLGFGFGEVDCRTAIHKQVEEHGRDYQEVIVSLVDDYLQIVKDLASMVNAKPFFVGTIHQVRDMAVIHDHRDGADHIEKMRMAGIRGSQQERGMYRNRFNQELHTRGLPYIDYGAFGSEDGIADPALMGVDSIHLSHLLFPPQNARMLEFLKTLIESGY
jgi:hypothetical protein